MSEPTFRRVRLDLRRTYALLRFNTDSPQITMAEGGEAVPVFTSAAAAREFRAATSAECRQYRVRRLRWADLLTMLRDKMQEGVMWVAFNPTAHGPGGKANTDYMLILEFLAQAEDE